MSLITVIGRGHSGTRAMSHTLSASGAFMGAPLNGSGDLLPPQPMYDACRVFARYVRHTGGLTWDWREALGMAPPDEFITLIHRYLTSVHASPAEHKGWKIPETTLVFPWIIRLFPDAKYIFWIRDPRDCILGAHVTDDLGTFGVPYERCEDVYRRRAISWLYQYELVKATPKPQHWLEVRLEDFVLRQRETLDRLGAFLGFPLTAIPVKPEVVGRYLRDPTHRDFAFLAPALAEFGYAPPKT